MEIPASHLRHMFFNITQVNGRCLSNARSVTQVNGRGSFSGFMDLIVASSWRDKCFLEPLSSAEAPMQAFKLEWE